MLQVIDRKLLKLAHQACSDKPQAMGQCQGVPIKEFQRDQETAALGCLFFFPIRDGDSPTPPSNQDYSVNIGRPGAVLLEFSLEIGDLHGPTSCHCFKIKCVKI